MARLAGASVLPLRLKLRVILGSMARKSGYMEATHEALNRVANAPTWTGTAVVLLKSQV